MNGPAHNELKPHQFDNEHTLRLVDEAIRLLRQWARESRKRRCPGGPKRCRGRIRHRLKMRRSIFAHASEEDERFYYETLATEWPF